MTVTHSIEDNDQDLQRAFKVFGDAWTLAIINVLSEAAQRFNELQRGINVSPTTLADRLKKLEQLGLVAQQQTLDQLSNCYVLTTKGQNMLPVLRAIESFSKKFL